VIGTMGAKFVIALIGPDQVSADLELPSWIVCAYIPRLVPDVLSLLQVSWLFFRIGELPHHDPSRVEGTDPLHPEGITR